MKQFINRIKQMIPNRRSLLKFLTVLAIISFFTTYISLALNNQDTLIPQNPLVEAAENSSQVPLLSGYKDLVEAPDITEEDEVKEKEESDLDEDLKEKKNKDKKENKKESKKEMKEKDSTDKQGKNNDSSKDGSEIDDGSGGDGKTDSLSNIEITDDNDKEKEENKYFTTTIENNQIVNKEDYSFVIEQLEHDYTVKEASVKVASNKDAVQSITDDYTKPIDVNLKLSEGENNITISVSYQDSKGKQFTVTKSYNVILDVKNIIIETDLEDGEVYNEALQFKASAFMGSNKIPVSVSFNNESIDETSKDTFDVLLNEGENKIDMIAEKQGEKTAQEYTIHYYKPNLTIKTNLEDKAVNDPNLSFTAEAFDGEEKADIKINHNDEDVSENSDGTYSVTLVEGENHFEIIAQKADVVHKEVYTVKYSTESSGEEDNDEDEEQNENIPTIEILDVTDGETIKNKTRTFHVKANSHSGKTLSGGNGTIKVTNNGNAVPMDWTDSDKTSFTLPIENGENKVIVTAIDPEGNTGTKQITLYGEIVEDGGVVGTATISLEATTIGLGSIIPAQNVELYQGERGSQVLDRLFKDHGIKYDYTGNHENSFYLSAIYKPGLVTNPVIPEDLAERIERDLSRFEPEDYLTDSLGEFDFSNGSGWMYSVNGHYPNVGFADYYFKDGDVVRIRFTLAYGADIGGGMPGSNYGKEW